MAKIGKFDKYSGGLKKTVSADVYYHIHKSRSSGSSGFFYIEIPKEFDSLYEQDEHAQKFVNRGNSKIIIKGKTADEALDRYILYLLMYAGAKSVTVKVILYRFTFSSRDKSSDPTKGFSGVSLTYEAKIEFDFVVCEKVDFNGKVTYTPIEKRQTNMSRDSFDKVKKIAGGHYGGWVELPYSKETETFFTTVYTGMEKIMDSLMNHLGTEEKVMLAMQSKHKLLA